MLIHIKQFYGTLGTSELTMSQAHILGGSLVGCRGVAISKVGLELKVRSLRSLDHPLKKTGEKNAHNGRLGWRNLL